MKKSLIIALTALASSVSAFASSDFSFGTSNDGGFSVIGQFGMNISNFRMNQLPTMDGKVGFNTGIHAEYLLPECYGVYLNAGLDYGMKGAKKRIELLKATAVTRPMYLSIPIHVGYRYEVMEDLGVYADFGPYFALGTNGKHVLKNDDYSTDVKHSFFNDDSNVNFYEVKRADFGLGFRIGAEYAQHYNLVFSCDWGITEMLTQEQKNALYLAGAQDASMKNFAAGVTFGYRF